MRITAARTKALVFLSFCFAAGVAVAGAMAAEAPVPLDPGVTGYPNSIASTGDSITRAFDSSSFGDNPANSWSTGTNGAVNSHYLRILAANPGINNHFYNDAVTGAKMTALDGQVMNVNSQQAEYVTILMGANDACTSTEGGMTSVAVFNQQFQTAINTLAAGSPNARIYVSSIPSIYNLWAILHTNSSAVSAWNTFGICQSMLANPTSTAQPDVDRRARVNQRVVDFNAQLASVCATDIHCRFDNNGTYNSNFVPSQVSTIDYFHPSLSGQAFLATETYSTTFDFTDNIPPVSQAVVTPTLECSLLVGITATDNFGVSGIEYRMNAGGYVRYTAPVSVTAATTITYRAVDVNGNIEASHSITAPPCPSSTPTSTPSGPTATPGLPTFTATVPPATPNMSATATQPSPTPTLTSTPTTTPSPLIPTSTASPPAPSATSTPAQASATPTLPGSTATDTPAVPPASETATLGVPTPTVGAPTSTPAAPTPTATLCAISFSDVHPADYFYGALRYLFCHGVISGYSDGTFRPYNNTTRSQMVKIVILGYGKPIMTPAGGAYTFTDVPPANTFFAVVETAYTDGIVAGYTCGAAPAGPCDSAHRPYFLPANSVTRGQLAKIDVLAAGWTPIDPPTPTFADVPHASAFYTMIETAVCHGVVSGYSDHTYRPFNNATRGQISKIVYQSLISPGACQ